MPRDLSNGRFQPGASGNPGGRPAGDASVRLAARLSSGNAVLLLIRVVDNREAAWSTRVSAARQLIALGYGRPRRAADLVSDLPELDASVRDAVRLFIKRYRRA